MVITVGASVEGSQEPESFGQFLTQYSESDTWDRLGDIDLGPLSSKDFSRLCSVLVV